MAAEYTVRFKGENSSVLAKARGTEKALGQVATKVTQHNRVMAQSAEKTAKTQTTALTRTRREVDASSRSFHRAERELGGMTRGAIAGSGMMRHLGRSVAFASATFLGTAGLINVVRTSINRATDLGSSVLRTNIIFGKAAKEVRAWSRTTFSSLGIARDAALSYANAFGAILTQFGLAPSEAARAAQALTKIGAAISLGRGEVDPANAMTALTGAIAGRARALRAYGIVIDNVAVKAEAMRLGLVKTTVDTAKVTAAQRRLAEAEAVLIDTRKRHTANSVAVARAEDAVTAAHGALAKATSGSTVQLTANQKAQATLSLITQKSARFTDNYGKLMNTAAGRQRRFHQGVGELEAELGRGLLPMFNRALVTLNRWIASIAEGGKNHDQFVKTMQTVRRVVGQAVTVLKVMAGVGRNIAAIFGGWENAFKIIISLYLANKFLKLAWAIRESRIALLLVGRTAPVVAGKVVASEAAMTAGATTFAGRLSLVRLRLLALLGPIGLVAAALVGAKTLWDQFNPGGIAGDVVRGSNPYPVGTDLHDQWEAGRAGKKKGSKIPVGTTGGFMRAGGPAYQAGKRFGNTQTRKPGTIAGDVLGIAQTPGASSVGFHLPGEARPHDCSAFTQAVFRQHGISIPRTSQTQFASAPVKSRQKAGMMPGDLIFFKRGLGPPPGHVGIYIGGGSMVSDHGASGGVSQTGIDWGNFYGWGRYTGAGHPAADTPVTGAPADTAGGPSLVVDHPRSPKKARIADIAGIRQTVDFIAKNVAQVIPPALRRRIENQVVSIRKLLAGVVTPAELRAAHKQLTALKSLYSRSIDLSGSIRTMRKQLASMATVIERMPPEVRGKLRLQMAALRKELENVTTAGGIRRIKKKLEAIGKLIQAAIEAATAKAEKARDRLHNVLGTIVDKALRVFDAQTDKLVEAARAPFEAATESERALQALQARRQETDIGRQREDAQTNLARAYRLGDPTLIKNALRELQDIEDAALEQKLTDQAAIEREAAGKQADAAEQTVRDQREQVRELFAARLEEMITGFDEEGGLTTENVNKLLGLLGEYGVDFAAAGSLIGQAFATGFLGAFDRLYAAIGELVTALNAVAVASGTGALPVTAHDRVMAAIPRRWINSVTGAPGAGAVGGRPVPFGAGGVVVRPTEALIGERGKAEAVLPLDSPEAQRLLGGGSGTTIHFTQIVEGSVARESDLWRDGAREIQKILKKGGSHPLAVRTTGSEKLGQRRQG